MEITELRRRARFFYETSDAYRKQNTQWIVDVDKMIDGDDYNSIYKQLSEIYNEKNARQSEFSINSRVSVTDLIKRYKTQMAHNLARFQASFAHALITAAGAARGGVAEQYVHNIAGDTQMGDFATEVINDIIENDMTRKKFPDFASEVFKYNSAILVVKEHGIKGSAFKFKTKLYSGKYVLYDPQADERDIQTSRFIGIDGFNYTLDILKRMKQDNMAKKKGYLMDGIDELIRARGNSKEELDGSNEKDIPMVQMYIYDEGEEKTHHIIFDKMDKIIVKRSVEDNVVAGGREVRFNVVGGIRNTKHDSKHYTKSDFYMQIPTLKSRVSLHIDILNTVAQVRSNVIMVHPNAYQSVLKAFVEGFPIAQASATASQTIPVQNQITALDQPNLTGLQNVLNQFEEMYANLFPENTPELRGNVEDKLKSVYEGNVSIIRQIIESKSPLENAMRDLYLIIIRILIQERSAEFLVRSTSLGGFPLNRILSSKLLRPSDDETITSVPIDIRAKMGEQTDFIMKKDFIAQVFSSAQEGGVNIRNFSKWIARNANKVQARLTPDDLYCIYSPYEDTVVRQVLNDLKMVAVGDKVVYPNDIVGVDYMNTLQDCINKKAATYVDPDGEFTKEGKRVYEFARDMMRMFAESKTQGSPAFQENQVSALEQEEQFRNPPQGREDLGRAIFANQKTFADNNPSPLG